MEVLQRNLAIAKVQFLVFLLVVGVISGCSTQPEAPTPISKAKVTVPSDLGILRSPLGEPFVPTEAGADETLLKQTLEQYAADERPESLKLELFEEFLAQHPESPWAPSVSLNLALTYKATGRHTRALARFKRAWEDFKEVEGESQKLKALADRALGEYANALSNSGRVEELEPLMAAVEDRPLTGAATELVTVAREGLWVMENKVSTAFACGPGALGHLGELTTGWNDESRALLKTLPSTKRGTSLAQIYELSKKLGLDLQMAFREPGAVILTPSVGHFGIGHFSAVMKPENGLYPIQDSTMNLGTTQLHVEKIALEEEASGYFLVPSGPLPSGWRPVLNEEAETVWGRGYTGTRWELLATRLLDLLLGLFSRDPCGMTTWGVHTSLVGLQLTDTPVGLSPASFAIPFTVTYGAREAGQLAVPDYSNLGPKWSTTFTSYVVDGRANAFATIYKPGGGTDRFAFTLGGTVSQKGPYDQAILTFEGDGFGLDYPDGSRDEYKKLIGPRWHLTSRITPQGNTTTVVYDAADRISEIRDAAGRVMTLSYDLPGDPLKITQVTDPFGRSATFTYTQDGHLESISDVLGLVSSYQYGANDFIEALTTPYGTTTFSSQDFPTAPGAGTIRVLTVTDPLGRNYRIEAAEGPSTGVPYSEPTVPVGMPVHNLVLDGRNTFVWEPHQLGASPDYSKATIYHFMHIGLSKSRVLQSIKRPLENRIWYAYNGASTFFVGDNNVTEIGRVLDDGTTQLTKYQYNDKGNVTQMTDPAGRVFDYGYAPNEIDLTSVVTDQQTLLTASYDGNHNITSITDASGGVSNFTYNARGQVLTATNPLGETTTNTYTPTGNLASIQAPLQAITTFGYDSAERVSSATDTEGYTVQATYDSFDRPVSVTYPDGTSDTLTYQNLDLVSTTDRIGRQTQRTYDALQRPTSVIDGNGGTTTLTYGLENSPLSLIDPNGNTTNFQYDLQERLTTKQYPGGATQTTTYEACMSRVASVTDALGQNKTYQYFIDNQLKSIDYSGNTPTVTFTQDSFLPRPLTMTDGQGVTTMTYGPVGSPGANALASISGPYGDQASFIYDIAGRPVSRTVNGSVESVLYDQLWRATSTTNLLDTFQMSYLGKTPQITEVSSNQGPTTQFAYTPNSTDRRLAQIKNLRNGGTTNISQFDYSYDAIGQITQMVKTHGDVGGGGDTTLTASKDSTLRAQKPHRNEGANPILMLSHRPDIVNKSNNPIIDFDLSNTNLTGLTSAKLVLTIKECDIPKRWGKNGRFIIAQPVDHPWVEGNGKRLKVPAGERTRGDGEGTTWFSPVDENISNKKADSAVEWNGARDFLGSLTAPPVNVTNGQTGPIEFDVTADLQAGFQNGWLLRKQDESKFGNIRFYSKEGAADAGNPDYAPRLVLEFGGQGASPSLAGLDDEGTIGQMLEVLESVWGIDTSSWDPEAESQPVLATAVTNSTETLDFRYDNLSQLIGVDINQTPHATYQFDPAGNMTSITLNGVTTNLTYNSRNQIETPGTNVFDAKGQTAAQDGRTFEWDEQGRVTAIVQGTHRSEFEYDGLSRRTAIVEIENGVVESRKLYWWLGGTIVCERDGLQPGFPIAKRYFGQGVMDGTTKLYYTLDHLGSIQELTDESGEVVTDYRYSIYGERTKDSGTADSDFGFAGLFHHAPSGLDLATYRLYDSRQRRFISRDPLGEGFDYNLYRYANSNPVMFIDPEGLIPLSHDPWNTRYHANVTHSGGPQARWERTVVSAGGAALLGTLFGPEFFLAWRSAMMTSPVATTTATVVVAETATGYDGPGALPLSTPCTKSAAAKRIARNQKAGAAFEAKIVDSLRRSGYTEAQGYTIVTQKHFRTPYGSRYLDAAVYKGDELILGIEAKAGNSRYHTSQLKKDLWIEQEYGINIALIREP